MAQADVCVLVPHFKDEYWLSVGYGLEQEARSQGVALNLQEAGGYLAQETQTAQVNSCVDTGAEAILIGAVSSDQPDLLAAVARAARTIPVIGLVNELHSDALSGAVGVDWRDMGLAVGDELARLYPKGDGAPVAALISGPTQSGWVGPLEAGLREGLSQSSVTIGAVYAADTSLRAQFASTADALSAKPPPDILIGSAPAIEAAMGILAAEPDRPAPVLIATYVSHSVWRGLSSGQVAAAPFDDPALQGRMAIRMLTAQQQGEPPSGVVGPDIRLMRKGALPDTMPLSPASYYPIVN